MPHSRRDLRLASGLVLFTYVALHLTCHALGIVSLATAESALHATVLFWQSVPGTVLLYSAATIHVALAMLTVYERRTLRMPPIQALRIALGLAMPIALIGHFIATRYAFEKFGLAPEYARVVPNLWARSASNLSLGLLAPGWIHGCLGLKLAFGHRAAWQRLRPVLFGAALLIPVLAALGFVNMGRELETSAAAQAIARGAADLRHEAPLFETREGAQLAYIAILFSIALARFARSLAERRRKSVVWIRYPQRTVSVPRGWSVLDASRSFGIPHQALCGGRARCTTCRVAVLAGESNCPEPAGDERRALERIVGVASNVRLACQLRPTGDISVAPILAAPASRRRAAPALRATEHDAVVVLFDVRVGAADAASVSGHDALYALGRFLAVAEAAAADADAELHRHSLSSWIVLLRSADDLAPAVARALALAARIDAEAESLATALARDLGVRARHWLVVHVGRVVLGAIGEASATTALLGRAVDDIEAIRSDLPQIGAAVIVSAHAAAAGGLAQTELRRLDAHGGAADDRRAARWWAAASPARALPS